MKQVGTFPVFSLAAALILGCGGASEVRNDTGTRKQMSQTPPTHTINQTPKSAPRRANPTRCEALKAKRMEEDPQAPMPGIPRFEEPMTAPVLVAGAEVTYTEEAYKARIEGTAHARCVITELGSVGDCTILDAPSGLEDAVKVALTRTKYKPATWEGSPIAVDYPIEFKVQLPSSPPPVSKPPPTPNTKHFGEGMTRPTMVSGRDPVYTGEALQACIEGLMMVRCQIQTDGVVTNCRTIKALPYMEATVLEALQSRRYTPVTFKGQLVQVDYVFNIKLVLPRSK